MTPLFDVPLWGYEPCTTCGRQVPLTTYALTCPCFDPRTRILVAWVCEDCDVIAGTVGLFSSWSDAISAGQSTLDDRASRYLGNASNIVTSDRRRNVIAESRRSSTKQPRR
jgi:hypothetical protein